MELPKIIANPTEEYVTIPALKTFAKENGISIARDEKASYIQAISDFADRDPDSKALVVDWIDNVVKAGIKEIQVRSIPIGEKLESLFSSTIAAQNYLNQFITAHSPHLTGNVYGNNYDIISANIKSDEHGKFVSIFFCRMLRYYDIKGARGGIVEYPIFVDYYYERGWLIVRYKSRSGLYEILPDGTPFEEWIQHSLNVSQEVKTVLGKVSNIFQFGGVDAHSASTLMRTKFFELLDKYTHTPAEILEILNANEADIHTLEDMFMRMCSIPISYREKVGRDLRTMEEKYLSVTWPDKSVFIKDREAYPTRLTTTDEEESRIDQTAVTEDDPLQTKEVFFDNKRMLYNQKRCDGLTLMWRRKDKKYYGEFFPVKFSEKGGICTLSFKKYVAEEDVLHVLFAIIDT